MHGLAPSAKMSLGRRVHSWPVRSHGPPLDVPEGFPFLTDDLKDPLAPIAGVGVSPGHGDTRGSPGGSSCASILGAWRAVHRPPPAPSAIHRIVAARRPKFREPARRSSSTEFLPRSATALGSAPGYSPAYIAYCQVPGPRKTPRLGGRPSIRRSAALRRTRCAVPGEEGIDPYVAILVPSLADRIEDPLAGPLAAAYEAYEHDPPRDAHAGFPEGSPPPAEDAPGGIHEFGDSFLHAHGSEVPFLARFLPERLKDSLARPEARNLRLASHDGNPGRHEGSLPTPEMPEGRSNEPSLPLLHGSPARILVPAPLQPYRSEDLLRRPSDGLSSS